MNTVAALFNLSPLDLVVILSIVLVLYALKNSK